LGVSLAGVDCQSVAGVWAREISAMVGQQIPLVPMKHAYVVTEEVPGGVRTLPNVRDHDSSVYFRVQGDALCVGGYEPNPIILDNVRSHFNQICSFIRASGTNVKQIWRYG